MKILFYLTLISILFLSCNSTNKAINTAESAVNYISLNDYNKFLELCTDDLKEHEKYLKKQFNECYLF